MENNGGVATASSSTMQEQEQQPSSLFDAVAKKDYNAIAEMYASNARKTIIAFLSMRSRWSSTVSNVGYEGKSEEKLDEFLQQLAYQETYLHGTPQMRYNSSNSWEQKVAPSNNNNDNKSSSTNNDVDDLSYHFILRELAAFSTEDRDQVQKHMQPMNYETPKEVESSGYESEHASCEEHRQPALKKTCHNSTPPHFQQQQHRPMDVVASVEETTDIEITRDIDRLLWDSASILSDSRPPNNFVVYNKNGSTTPPTKNNNNKQQGPPIFDGSVSNATPPPLGGAAAIHGGATGGAGTILHLACALDRPLALAFFLAMGADARSTHTAFRRLMTHEAACNGSVQCLTLLLELARSFRTSDDVASAAATASPKTQSPTAAAKLCHNDTRNGNMNPPNFVGCFIPLDDLEASARVAGRQQQQQQNIYAVNMKQDDLSSNTLDFISFLRFFRYTSDMVERGIMSELDGARSIVSQVTIRETSRNSLARSCSFQKMENNHSPSPHGFPRFRPHNGGCTDGHGNTPLHWAAFKNETKCVSLLLEYDADPNARAHPSGWTPLHDAAYSNSSDSIELLVNAGAKVDARANSGATPLCFAAQEDAAAAAKLLLERGADIAIRCAGGPLRGDVNGGDNNNNGGGGQQMAPAHHHPHSRFSGYTPLHYCAHYNAYNAAHALLKHHAAKKAMEIPDLSDRLPIHVAVARGSSDVLRELLHAGARVDTHPSNSRAKRTRSSNTGGIPWRLTARTIRRSNQQAQEHQSQQIYHPRQVQVQEATTTPVIVPAPATPTSVVVAPRQQPPPNLDVLLAPTTPRASLTLDMNIVNGTTSLNNTPVSSPVLRAMIPSQPITSSKPWNCLTQRSIDECRELISHAEKNWAPDRHQLFTPVDRRAVLELLRVGKRLEQKGTGIFIDLWPLVLSFCGRGWFEVDDTLSIGFASESEASTQSNSKSQETGEQGSFCSSLEECPSDEEHHDPLALPTLNHGFNR